MNLRLARDAFFPDYALGRLYLNGSLECHTLEDPVREIVGRPVEEWKVLGKTAIPSGVYKVIITPSVRFKRPLPLLVDVPGFVGIRIHAGNTHLDTEGCILTGQDRLADRIVRSQMALASLLTKLRTALDAGEPVTIEVGAELL